MQHSAMLRENICFSGRYWQFLRGKLGVLTYATKSFIRGNSQFQKSKLGVPAAETVNVLQACLNGKGAESCFETAPSNI